VPLHIAWSRCVFEEADDGLRFLLEQHVETNIATMEIYEDNADKDIAIHAKQALKLASRFISMEKKKQD
jgi:hypothetical protein